MIYSLGICSVYVLMSAAVYAGGYWVRDVPIAGVIHSPGISARVIRTPAGTPDPLLSFLWEDPLPVFIQESGSSQPPPGIAYIALSSCASRPWETMRTQRSTHPMRDECLKKENNMNVKS